MDAQYKAKLQDKIKDTQERLLAMQAFSAGAPVWFSRDGATWVKVVSSDGRTLAFDPDIEYRTTPPEPPNLKLEIELMPETALVLLAVLSTNEHDTKELIKLWPGYTPHIKVPHDTGYKAFWLPEDSLAVKLRKYLDEVVRAKES